MEDTEKITVRIPRIHYEMIELLISWSDSSSVSEVVREAVKEYVYKRIPLVRKVREEAKEAMEALRMEREIQEEMSDRFLKR